MLYIFKATGKFKKRKNVKILSFLLILMLFLIGNSDCFAVSLPQLNNSDVYLKQHTPVTCTLSSCAMIMRRTAIAVGRKDYMNITEESIKDDGWVSGIGLLWDFDSYGISIGNDDFPAKDKKQFLLKLLDNYPQGVEVYNSGHGGQDHAIIITDYDEGTDTFYGADPSSNTPSGRIKLSQTSIYGETQDEKIDNLDAFWYVSSPKVFNINGDITSNNQYNSYSDLKAFESSKKNVNKYFVVDDPEESTSPLRYAPSGNANCVEYALNGRILYIVSSGKNAYGSSWYKTSDGYYIFADNLTKFSDYSSEIKSFEKTSKAVNETDTVYCVFDNKAAFRIDPTEGNNIAGYLSNNSRVHIVRTGKNSIGTSWSQADNGYYIKSSDLKKYSNGKKDISSFPKASAISGEYYVEPFGDISGDVERVNRTYKTTASWLKVRVLPVNGYSVDAIPENSVVTVTLIQNNWGYIDFNGIKGWISLDYAKFVRNNTTNPTEISELKLSAKSTAVNNEITCLVNCTGGADDLKYRFCVLDDNGDIVQDTVEGSSPLLSFKTKEPGKYRFDVTVTDSSDKTITKKSDEFVVMGECRINSIDAVKSRVGITQTIIWDIDVENVKHNYKMLVEISDGEKSVFSEEIEPTKRYEFIPTAQGEYTLTVTTYSDVYSKTSYTSKPVKVSKYTLEKGDIDGDKKITPRDARLVLRYTAKLTKLTDEQLYAADVRNIGKVTAADARIILRASAKLQSIQ